MHLGSYNAAQRHYDAFRDLTPAEVSLHTKYTRCLTEARERLSLFRMLDRNYADWRNYLNRLLAADFREDVDVSEELKRLLLNYLTFAYTIQEHFVVSFRQRFKKQPGILKKYSDFLDRLCTACWPFAFILDYRGYVQHVGLGVSANSRTASDTSIRIKITANAKTLLAESREWKRSKLTAEKGELDLVAILKEFHVQMLQSYATFVARTFFPELYPADEFYADLTKEIQERHPAARMIFFSKKPEFAPEAGRKASLNMNIIMAPNDVFAELGVKVDEGAQR